jgi:uncharacterized protein with ParB-like and HNH nuclease domain
MDNDIEFDVLGIAEMLKRDILVVPSNQREYSWMKNTQVKRFLQDISHAMRDRHQSYFLGTVVLTRNKNRVLEIADGQQRLATTTMVLAAIRDYFAEKGDSRTMQSIENEFLSTYDRIKGEDISRLTLNTDDNDFFVNNVVFRKQHRKNTPPQRRSHKLISDAFDEIKEHIKGIERQTGEINAKQQLNEMIEYLKEKTRIVKLVVGNEETAFTLFETLNDRGLKTSQADLVKNHIFKLADNRLNEAQRLWSSMKGAIETISDIDDDITMDFLRNACCVFAGQTTKKDVLKKIQERSSNKSDSIHILSVLEELSKEYAAILNPDHHKWNQYTDDVRESIITMNLLGVTQIRPLMLAVSMYFNKKDTADSFKKLVAWSVRFIILGVRGGRLDEGYAKLANSIYKKEIKNSSDLKKDSEKIVISDSEFKSAFETASVSVAKLARYYLRSLENTARNEPSPELIPNDNTVINLEHIMPQTLNNDWSYIDIQDIDSHLNRIGNLILMQADKNSKIGNLSFKEKIKVYKRSSFLLTSQIAELEKWDIEEIENRQKLLAELAVKTWQL